MIMDKLKPIFTEDDCAPDSLEYFKKQLLTIGVNFDELKNTDNYCLNSEPDEVCYNNGSYLLYQDAYDQLWELYKTSDVAKYNSHLKRFI